MLDKIIIQNTEHRHHHRVEVSEKRAPTDESIRLAKEYEEKAWREVAGRVVKEIKGIDAEFVQVEATHYDMSLHIFFKLNGRPVRVRYEREFTGEVLQGVAQKITEEVMRTLLNSTNGRIL